ncbi:type IV pili twitching motility protein PilT [Veronia nyctiphanis]|uniref:Type IV pili twitching motility protein PilT n=1 Tax=Veronia nyctiphanis TaxID=1278244 RepID=A0A4Q0YQH5_9GAMM|nr:PilT/PilU family type 4a pilus ATPase [Veronia nyctiphanis]RXJ72294.1 type IV pili twitching motility protein PilT [Veronia nyctiphanis]
MLENLLDEINLRGASDCYITVGAKPMLRVDGQLTPYASEMTKELICILLKECMDMEQWQTFEIHKEANFALVSERGRFRVSAFWQRDMPGAVIRRIQTEIPEIEELGLPAVMQDLAVAKRGLVLVVGATGSGKSTSMAAMIGFRNKHLSGHILTVEDPIEFVHPHQACIVTQREIGIDTESYEIALKNSLRQAPDMIMIGEIRTQETMEYAMQFAETGHLCIATLHANNANQALERILHLVPKERREQFLFDLSLNLKGVLAQQLIPDVSGKGRHGAFECLINTSSVSDLIRRGELHELKTTISRGHNAGMCSFDQSLFALLQQGKITERDALHHADSQNDLKLMIKMNNDQTSPETLKKITIDMG